MSHVRSGNAAVTGLALLAAGLVAVPATKIGGTDVVVSEVYGGGGNSGATIHP